MANILFGLESPDEVPVAARLRGAFVAAGHQVRTAWFGGRESLAVARSAGLAGEAHDEAPAPGLPPAAVAAAAASFAARELHGVDATICFGDGPFALALAIATTTAGRLAVRPLSWPDRGQRGRLLDHAVSLCGVADAAAAEHLRRAGVPATHLVPVGALNGDGPAAASAAATLVDHVVRLLPTAAAPAAVDDRLPSDGDASGRTLGEDEVQLVAAAIRSGTLNSTRGTFVTGFERDFAAWLGRKHVIACASGTAAVHCAIQALQLAAGDEVITTPITDMGALTPILYEGAVPVFADVDRRTLNVTADHIAAQLTDRTRAIIVTHLFGLPAELDAILALAGRRGIPVIEDAAQAFGATHRGRRIGTFGQLAAFSLQQGKHITTGEGGLVATDDDALARRVFLAVNKAWGYGDTKPDHYFPALNYRLTELQGAVGRAQLPKLDDVVRRRREVAAALRQGLAEEPALHLPQDPPHGTHSYWKFVFFVDPAQVPGGAVALGKRMQAAGISCVPRYIQKPAFECALFQDWQRSPVTSLPLQRSARGDGKRPLFERTAYPGAVQALDDVIVLPLNERYAARHVARVVAGIRSALQELRRG